MNGDGYETRQVFLFHAFVCIFGLDGAQNTPYILITLNDYKIFCN